MKTISYAYLFVLAIVGISCKSAQPDLVANPPVTANWVNVDSLFSLTDHQAIDVYADSAGIVFLTKNGLTFWPKATNQPVSYNFPYYSFNNPSHAFYKGCAYVVTAENTITAIPYARSGDRPFTLTLDEFSLPPAQFSPYKGAETLVINETGQMLILLRAKANAYEYLYTLQLDASGHPVKNTSNTKIGKQVPLPLDSTFEDNYLGLFFSDNQLYCSVSRDYNHNGNPLTVGWVQELQQVTPDNTLQTTLPRLSTFNVIPYRNVLYAFTAPIDSASYGNYNYYYRFYTSVDHGLTWRPGSKLLSSADSRYDHSFSHFYTLANRLTAINLTNYLLEVDLDNDQVKRLSLSGITEANRYLTGLAEYEGYVYLSTILGGVYRKPVKDFWQYDSQ